MPSSFSKGEFGCVGVFVKEDSGCFVGVVGSNGDVGAVRDAVVFQCVVKGSVLCAVECSFDVEGCYDTFVVLPSVGEV